MDDLENKFISLSTLYSILEKYIEKYPEDVEKFVEYIKGNELTTYDTRYTYHRGQGEKDENIIKKYQNFYITKPQNPVNNHKDGCLLCKKSWESTPEYVKSTLLCGHTYHTFCTDLQMYNTDHMRCIVDGCEINSWQHIRKIVREKELLKEGVENILINSYKKRLDFRKNLIDLNACIRNTVKSHRAIDGLIRTKKNEMLHKHIHNINQIQLDINNEVKNIKSSEEVAEYKANIRKYRKSARVIFSKYHLSFRELHARRLVKCPWRTRYILERHRANTYKFGFKIRAGKKKWDDPLDV
jgi:hypothetical protein